MTAPTGTEEADPAIPPLSIDRHKMNSPCTYSAEDHGKISFRHSIFRSTDSGKQLAHLLLISSGEDAKRFERKGNMKDRKFILHLLGELPELERRGLLDAETGKRLECFYRKQLDAGTERKWLLWSIAFIGGLMISGGIILLTAHNWDMLPKCWKIGISFAPFVLSGGFGILTLARRLGRTAENTAAMLISASIAGVMALISQIYHIHGSMFDYLTLVLGLSLPLVYVFRSVVLGTLFPLFLLFYSATLARGDSAWIPFAYTLLWLPFALRQFWKPDSVAAGAMRYVLPIGAAALLVQFGISTKTESDLLLEFLCIGAAGFLNAGLILRDEKKGKFGNPWLISGYGHSCCSAAGVELQIRKTSPSAGDGRGRSFFPGGLGDLHGGNALFPAVSFSFEKLYVGLSALLPFGMNLVSPMGSDLLSSLYLGGLGIVLIGTASGAGI